MGKERTSEVHQTLRVRDWARLLWSKKRVNQWSAVNQLRHIKHSDARKALEKRLLNRKKTLGRPVDDATTRLNAARALGDHAHLDSILVLVRALRDPDVNVQQMAANVLAGLWKTNRASETAAVQSRKDVRALNTVFPHVKMDAEGIVEDDPRVVREALAQALSGALTGRNAEARVSRLRRDAAQARK